MHPILNHRRRLVIYALAWLLIGALLALGFHGGTPLLAAAFFVPLTLVFGAVCLSAWYVCRAFPLDDRLRPANVAAAHLLAGVLTSMAWIGLAGIWARPLDWLTGGSDLASLFATHRALLLAIAVLLFWLTAAFFYLLTAFEASREADRHALELSLLAREAELKALRAQIDPHFIFNSLHSISALTTADPEAARRMCLLLADFLRETLRLGETSRIRLEAELALAERYLAIEQVRLGARLQVAREADPDAMVCLVPSLLLQPLVENAVVHGVSQLLDGGTIRVSATRSGSILTVVLENPCDPDRPQTRGVGLGLELLRRRLTTEFGPYDAVHAAEAAGQFRVEVRLPAVTEDDNRP